MHFPKAASSTLVACALFAAQTGMSPELVETVARESEEISRRHTFRRFADTRRLKWAGSLVSVPMLLRHTAIALPILPEPRSMRIALDQRPLP